MSAPLISVIMPVYNTAVYLPEAIQSIIQQTFTDFEFIIIDDASTDTSIEVIKQYKDPRIQLISKPVNTGYTESLNMGLRIASGKFIARMDSDDISHPLRFKKQIEFLQSDSSIGVCGTWFKTIGTREVFKPPVDDNDIKIALLHYCPFGHPTVMIRKSLLDTNFITYDSSFEPAEDYHLWARLVPYCNFRNIPEVLLDYRVHDKQVSQTRLIKQTQSKDAIRLFQLAHLKLNATTSQQALHQALLNVNCSRSQYFLSISELGNWVQTLIESNQKVRVYETEKFDTLILSFWSQSFQNYFSYDLSVLKFALFTPLPSFSTFNNTLSAIKFVVKCLITWKR